MDEGARQNSSKRRQGDPNKDGLSPMPSERKRENPISKFNADLPREPSESKPKSSKVKKHPTNQNLPKQKLAAGM